MVLKVIGAGYGRTGTLSTRTALERLGLPCYHMFEVVLNPANRGHLDFWCDVADAPSGTQHDWERVYARYTAAVDHPTSCVWRELTAAYPDAKVLLTIHPKGAEGWFDSAISTIYFSQSRWQYKLIGTFVPYARKFGDMVETLIWRRFHRGTMPDRAKAIAEYERHVAEVKASVPPDKLLVFSVDQGWKPLCDFLELPVPSTPFPKVNDRDKFRRLIRLIDSGAYAILAVLAIAAIAVVYGFARLTSP